MCQLGVILLALCLFLCQEACRGQGVLVGEEVITPIGELDAGRRKPTRRRRLLLQQNQRHHDAAVVPVVAAVALGGSSNTTCGGVLVAPDVILTVRGVCEVEWTQGARIVLGHRQRQNLLPVSAEDHLREVQALYDGLSEDDEHRLMLVHLSQPVPDAAFASYCYMESESTQPLQVLLLEADDKADQHADVVARLLKRVHNNDNTSSIFSTQVHTIKGGFCGGDVHGVGWPIVMTSTEHQEENPLPSKTTQPHLVGFVASWHRVEKDEYTDLTSENTCVTENIRVASYSDWIHQTLCCISDYVARDDCPERKQQEAHQEKCPYAARLWTMDHDHGVVPLQQEQQRRRQLQSEVEAPSAGPVKVNIPEPTRNPADVTVKPSESHQSATTRIPSLETAAPVPADNVGGESSGSPESATTPGETNAPAVSSAGGTPNSTVTPKAPPVSPPFTAGLTQEPIVAPLSAPSAMVGSNSTGALTIGPAAESPNNRSAMPDANGLPSAKPVDVAPISTPMSLPVPPPVRKPASIPSAAQPTKPPFLVALLPSHTVTSPTLANPSIKPSSSPVAGTTSEPSLSPSSFGGTTGPTASLGGTAGPTAVDGSLVSPSFSPAPKESLSGFPSSTSAPSPSATSAPGSASPSTEGGVNSPQLPAIFMIPSKECAPDLACSWVEKFPGYQMYIVKSDRCIERCQWTERMHVYKLIGWKCGFCP